MAALLGMLGMSVETKVSLATHDAASFAQSLSVPVAVHTALGDSTVVEELSVARDGTSVFGIVVNSHMSGFPIASLSITCAIVRWDIQTGAVLRSFLIGAGAQGFGGFSSTTASHLKISKDGASLYVLITEQKMSGMQITVSSKVVKIDIASGETGYQIHVGTSNMSPGSISAVSVRKMLQSKDGDFLMGLVVTASGGGFGGMSGSETLVCWSTQDGSQLSGQAIPVGQISMGLGSGQTMSVQDVKQSRDGSLVLAAVTSIDRQNIMSFTLNSALIKIDRASGAEAGRIPIGQVLQRLGQGQMLELAQLKVGRDGSSIFGVVAEYWNITFSMQYREASDIVQWDIASGEVKQVIHTPCTFLNLNKRMEAMQAQRKNHGRGSRSGQAANVTTASLQEKLKLSKDGRSIYGIISSMQPGMGQAWLSEWDIATGESAKSVQVGQISAAMGSSDSMALTQLNVSRDGNMLFGVVNESRSSMGGGGRASQGGAPASCGPMPCSIQ